MSNDTLRADQIAFHFYTKLFYIVNQARATEDAASNQKTDKWFNLETPDSDLFTKEEREPYRAVSLAPFPGPPTLEIDVLLSIPELTNNQVLVYMPPDSSRVRIEPTPKFILLETWSLGMTFHRPGSASDQHRDTSPDALPIIYKHGIILFRSVYSLLRVLPAWKFYKRLKRKISGFNRKGNLSIKLRVRNPGESETSTHILGFNARLSPTYRTPLPTSRHDFQAVPHLLGSFTLSTTYLTTPNFQLDELESILSSKFISLDLEGFVPTLDKNRQRDSLIGSSLPNSGSGLRSMLARSPPRAIARASSGNGAHGGAVTTDIADRFILPARIPSIGGAPTLGMTASSGTSALIPPPRPFPTMNNPNPNPHPLPNTSPLVATSPYSIPSPIPPTTTASGPASAVNRLRKESLNNSVSSSSSISTRDAQHGQVAANNNAGTSSSLSTSPVPTTSGALPIRRPTINPVHPFKSGTFSSTSGSSPSLSIRQGIGGSGGGVHGGGGGGGTGTGTGAASSPVGVPSSLSGAGGTTRPVSPHSAQSHGTHSRQPSSASPIGRGIPPPPSPMGHGAHHHSPSSVGAGAVFPSPSSLSDRDRRPGTSGSGASGGSLDRDRERRGSVGSGFGGGGGGGAEENLEGRSPVMNMPPPRKRYSSSFGHRYGGAGGSGGSATGLGLQVGSANSNHSGGDGGGGGGGGGGGVGVGGEKSPAVGAGAGAGGGGGGSAPASGRNTPALEGRKEGNPSFLGEGTTDDDEISIFVQDIDSRKPLSGRTKEREKRDRDRDRQREEFQRRDRDRDRDDDDDDKDYWRYDQRAHGHEPQREHEDTSPPSGQGQNKGKGKEREKEHPEPSSQWDDWHQPLCARRRLGDDARDATTSAPPVSLPLPVSTPDSIPLAQREQERERERAAQMSISPTRGGAMLTSQNEVEERLKKMNEAFFKSLEGLSAGSVRRKERQKEKEKDNAKDLKEKEKEGASPAGMTSTPSSERGGMGMGSTGGNASRAAQGYGLGLGGVGFPSRGSGGGGGGAGARASDPSRVDYPSPSPYQYTSPSSAGGGGMAPGLGHGHGLLERGRYSSTSSSTLATSEIGTSQGSEEVIGRLELYDEPSLRRRKG